MSVQSQVNNITYAGNSITTVFNYPFRITTSESLKVLLINNTSGEYTEQILNTNYTITGVDNVNGGTVNFTIAPPTGYSIFIGRLNQLYTQEMTFLPNSQFDLASLEKVLDRLALQDQQLDLKHKASLQLPPYEIAGLTIAPVSVRKNTVLGFGESGQLVYETIPSGSPTDYFIQAGTGAVERTWQNKVRELLSVADFGAIGDGITDDTVAIQNAINSLINNSNGGTLNLGRNKTYKISTALVLGSNITINGDLSTIILSSESGAYSFYGFNINNVNIYNCKFDGLGTFSSGFSNAFIAIYIEGESSKIEISNCQFAGFNEGIRLAYCSQVNIVNNKIANGGFGAIRNDLCSNVHIDCNEIYNIQGGPAGGIQFGDGIYFDGCNRVTVTNNRINRCIRIGIVLEASNPSILNDEFVISGNLISDLGGSVSPENNAGIWIEGGKSTSAVNISNNQVVYDNSWSGHKFFGILSTNGAVISNNYIRSNYMSSVDSGGIVFSGGDTIISNNYIYGFDNGLYNASQETAFVSALYSIKNNHITHCRLRGIYIYRCGTTFFIENNIIQDCGYGYVILGSYYAGAGLEIHSKAGNDPKYSLKSNTFISSVNENDTIGQIYGVLLSRAAGGDTTSGCLSFDNNTFVYKGNITTQYPHNLTFNNISNAIPIAVGRDSGSGSVSIRRDIVYDKSNNKSSKLPLGIADTIFPALVDVQFGEGNQRCVGHASTPPTSGNYMQGDYIYNTAVIHLGSVGSRYTILGWVCVTNGSPGTWVPQRVLSGD